MFCNAQIQLTSPKQRNVNRLILLHENILLEITFAGQMGNIILLENNSKLAGYIYIFPFFLALNITTLSYSLDKKLLEV